MNTDLVGLVLLYNTCAATHLAARLHAPTCNMVNVARARGGRGKVKLITEDVADTVADLEERGFPCPRCKCCKA